MTKHVIVDAVKDALWASSKAWRTPPLFKLFTQWSQNHKNCLNALFKATFFFDKKYLFIYRINTVLDEIPEILLSLFAEYFFYI